MISHAIINSIAPHAREDYKKTLVNCGDLLQAHRIDSPLRLAAFLATICHETGGLQIVRENMNYSRKRIKQVWPTRPKAVKFAHSPEELANCVYNGRMGNRLGTDDGYRYRGGGLIQLTGRSSYERAGDAIGVNLGVDPDLIEDPKISLMAACWEFSQHLQYCDLGERGWKSVCNAINRGNAMSRFDPIGWRDRQIWYSRCCDVLGISGKVEDDLLRLGDRGELVKALQERLKDLRYAVGRADGIFGQRTRAAVLAFQAENGLVTDGIIGPKTRTALNSEAAVAMPLGERATDTADDLKEAGSTTIDRTVKVKVAAKVAMAASATVGTVQEVGLLDGAGGLLKELTTLRTVTNGFVDVMGWASTHWYLSAALIGYLVWKWAKDIEFRRVFEHTTGVNLNR